MAVKRRGHVGQTKVKRYWPGKAPEWGEVAEEDEDVRMQKVIYVFDRAFPKNDDLEVPRKDDDPRLRRIAQTKIEHRVDVRADHRRRQAEIISTEEEEELRDQESRDEEEDEDALDERRRRIRAKNQERAQEEAALLPVEEDEEESEYETDSEDDDMSGITMIKTFFVPKTERDTITEREWLEAEEKALEELAKKKLEMRKAETKQIVVEEVKKDEESRKNMLLEEAYIGDVETDDEINEAEEYEVWRTREIARIKRERDPKEAMLREMEDIEKLRNMTEHERKNPKPSLAQLKKKRKIHINLV